MLLHLILSPSARDTAGAYSRAAFVCPHAFPSARDIGLEHSQSFIHVAAATELHEVFT